MLGSEGTRNDLLEEADNSGRGAFPLGVILGAFRPCRLWPFAPKRVLSQVADSLGLGHTDDSTRDVKAADAGDVIQETAVRATAAKKWTSTGSAVVERTFIHAADALLQQSRDRAAKKAVEDALKAARAVLLT